MLFFDKIYITTYNNFLSFIVNTFLLFIIRIWYYAIKFKKYDYDILIKTFYHPWSEYIDKCFKHKTVLTICHDPIPHSSDFWLKKKLYKKHIKSSNGIIVLTKRFMDVIHEEYGFDYKKIYYVPHGLLNLKTGKNTRKIKIINNNINYLFFGRIQDYKGVDDLINAFEVVNNKYCNTSLYIVGNGKIPENISQVAHKESVFIYNEYILDEDIEAFFSILNVICVLPYKNATQSGVIPIAMEFGVPVIASNQVGLWEQLDDGKIGIIYDNSSIQNLIDSMLLFVKHSDIYNKESKKCIEYGKRLNWTNIGKKIIENL